MPTPTKNHLLVAAVLLASLPCCLAQEAPSGLVSFAFNKSTVPVWDLTGDYQFDQSIQAVGDTTVDLSFGISITNDVQGRLRGSGVAFVAVGNDLVAGNYTASGRVSGGGQATRVTLQLRLTGDDVIGGVQTRFSISVKYDLTVNPQGLSLVGRARGNSSFAKLGSGPIHDDDISVSLPAGADGSWTAQMNIVPLNRLGGSGSIVLSNSRTLPTSLSGSFSTSTALAKVKLAGINEGRGTQLNLDFFTGASQPEAVNGKILGQTVRE